MNTRQTTTVLLLALVAGTVVVLNRQDYVPGQADRRADGHDAFADDVSLLVMDENGAPVYSMSAAHMTHYPTADRMVLDKPVLAIAHPGEGRWQLTAERGESTGNSDRVWLRGAVDLRRQAAGPRGPIHITARDVLVKPARQLAETDSTVLIITDSYRLEAVGLKADLRTHRLELRSRVRGRIHAAG